MDIPFIVSMLVFIATIFLIFKHPMVKIPFTSKYFHIDYGMAPLIGVLMLLLTFSIGIGTIERGIIGSGSVKPYSITILIMSLAYICVSLDFTGFFEYVSLRVARASKNSGGRLFLYLFLLTALLTLFTSNDIVILTMTLIIFYVCKSADINPIPFLLAQFFTVNTLGMALYIGNPTNIVAADAYGLSFMEFAKWMLLPSFIGAITCIALLWLIFRRRIPKRFKTTKIDPSSALKNRRGAMFGSAVLALTIVFMSLPAEWTGLPLWVIALFFAFVMFMHDIVSYRSKVSSISSRMPWKIAPFLVGLFIIIESLDATGWTGLFASKLMIFSGSTATMVLGICFISSLSAGVMNNHPMTIFFVRAFQSPAFTVSQTTRLGSTLALVAGSNFGANFTLIGALAGVMWAKMLSDKGCSISFSEFSKYGFLIMPPVIIATGLTLIMELMIWA